MRLGILTVMAGCAGVRSEVIASGNDGGYPDDALECTGDACCERVDAGLARSQLELVQVMDERIPGVEPIDVPDMDWEEQSVVVLHAVGVCPHDGFQIRMHGVSADESGLSIGADVGGSQGGGEIDTRPFAIVRVDWVGESVGVR